VYCFYLRRSCTLQCLFVCLLPVARSLPSCAMSVCPSVTRRHYVWTTKPISKLFWPPGSPITSFWPFTSVPNSKGNPVSGAQNTRGIFYWNHRLSRKRYEIDLWLLWWRIDKCRFRWPWVTANRGFKVTAYLQIEYLKNFVLETKLLYCIVVLIIVFFSVCTFCTNGDINNNNNKFVRPRWPYDMRPSVPAEKYIRYAGP